MFEEVVRDVITAWEQYNAKRKDSPPKPAPDSQDICTLSRIAFFASIKHEEGRPIQISLTLMDTNEIAEERKFNHGNVIMSFKRSLSFSVESLAKLSSAIDPRSTSFIISPSNRERAEYKIVGILSSGYRAKPLDDDPVTVPRPEVLTVTALNPGSLIFSRGGEIIGRYFSGEFETAKPTPFYSQAMGNYVLGVIRKHEEYREFKRIYWSFYISALERLFREAARRGHGGTVVWIPEARIPAAQQLLDSRFLFQGGPDGSDLLREISEYEREYKSCRQMFMELCNMPFPGEGFDPRVGVDFSSSAEMLARARRKFDEHVKLLAQLSCVDGALIISDRLRPISFGSHLQAEKWNGKTKTGPDGLGGQSQT